MSNKYMYGYVILREYVSICLFMKYYANYILLKYM